MRSARAVAGYDSASTMLRVLARTLRGQSSPMLGTGVPAWADPPLNAVLRGIDRLPRRARELLTTYGGIAEALPRERLGEVDTDALARWVTERYPRGRWPAVLVGSSNGALVHLAAALGIPWLPQTLLLPVRRPAIHPDDVRGDLEAMAPAVDRFLDANPRVAVHQMRDPIQDRLPVRRMSYLRMKWLRLPPAYRAFLDERVGDGGTILVSDCRTRWPTTAVRDRHVFQFGGIGGQSLGQMFEGGPRVRAFLARYGSPWRQWDPPEPDAERAEAEWGLREELLEDLRSYADGRGRRLLRLSHDEPQQASGPVAELYRSWLRDRGLAADRLVVEQFVFVDPLLTLRSGRVPYWTLFGIEPSRRQLEDWLQNTAPFRDIRMTLFSHGTVSLGMASGADWARLGGHATERFGWLGTDPARYPIDLRTIAGFHRDFARLPEAVPDAPPLELDRALHLLPGGRELTVEQLTEMR